MAKKRKLRGWNTYVKEAQRDSLMLPMPDGSEVELRYPSKRAIDILNRQTNDGEKRPTDDDFVTTLCGEAEGCRLLQAAADTPTGTLQLMLGDAMVEWQLWTANPFRKEDEQEAAADAADEQGNLPE